MLRVGIVALACIAAANAEVAKLSNVNGDLHVKLPETSNKFCVNDGTNIGCVSAADVVGKKDVDAVKTQIMDEVVPEIDSRIVALETGLTAKVDQVSAKVDELCKWGFEYMGSNGQCLKITECETGSTYEKEKPTPNSNRVCARVLECTNNEYELLAPAYHYNRVCKKVSACRAGMEFVLKEATASSDTVCAPALICKPGEYQEKDVTATADRVCKKVTTCDLSKTWVRAEATPTSDTVCGPLYLQSTADDGAAKGRAGASCDTIYKIRNGKTPGMRMIDQGVWVKAGGKPVAGICEGDVTSGFKLHYDGQTLKTKSDATCEMLFKALGGLKGSAFADKKTDDTVLYYSASAGIKTCKLGAGGQGSALGAGGKLVEMLNNNKFAGLKKTDFVFWIDSINGKVEGTSPIDMVHGQAFEWSSRWGRSYKLKQDGSQYHNQWWFEGYGYFRRANSDLKAHGLPGGQSDRTMFAWAKPSRESGWVNHLMHYGSTGCGRAYGLTYGHYHGKHWVGNHKLCGGWGYRGAEWTRRAMRFVGSVYKGRVMRTFTVADNSGNPRVVWASQTKSNEHNTDINQPSTNACRGYFRIGSRLCDWEWFYGGMSSAGMTKTAMNDAQIIAIYKATQEWRTKRD